MKRLFDAAARSPTRDQIAAFVVELVQGEAGFVTAPRDFFVPLFNECRKAGIPVWIDEVQTFGRVTELLGFRANSEEHKVQWLSTAGDSGVFLPLFEEILGSQEWPRRNLAMAR